MLVTVITVLVTMTTVLVTVETVSVTVTTMLGTVTTVLVLVSGNSDSDSDNSAVMNVLMTVTTVLVTATTVSVTVTRRNYGIAACVMMNIAQWQFEIMHHPIFGDFLWESWGVTPVLNQNTFLKFCVLI